MNHIPAIDQVIAVGRFLGNRDLLPASSGNLSVRVNDDTIAITRSGVEKAELTRADVTIIPLTEAPPPGTSAETGLHQAQYRADPKVGAILHVHSLASTVLSRRFAHRGEIVFSGYELQKAIHGVQSHEGELVLPIFDNSQDIPALAETVLNGLSGRPPVFGYLLAGHGLYAWGRDVAEARRHVIAFEFLLTALLEDLKLGTLERTPS